MTPTGTTRGGAGPSLLAVWDFDGTLADTFAAIRAAADRALAAHGLPAADATVLRSLVGRSLSHIFEQLTGGEDARLVAALTEAYYREFAETGPAHTTLFRRSAPPRAASSTGASGNAGTSGTGCSSGTSNACGRRAR